LEATSLIILKDSDLGAGGRGMESRMTDSKKMDLLRELFKTMEVLPFYSQCIFSVLLCVVSNKHLFTKNLEVHNHNTRSANNFHLPITY
jgi:hypothetical protein